MIGGWAAEILMTEFLDRTLAALYTISPDVQDDIAHVVLRLRGG